MERVLVMTEGGEPLPLPLARGLAMIPNLDVRRASTLEEALASIEREQPRLVVANTMSSCTAGIDLISELAQRKVQIPVLVLGADADPLGPRLPAGSSVQVVPSSTDALGIAGLVRRGLHAAAATSPSPFSVADYLQLAGMGRRTVELDVEHQGRPVGRIAIVEGEVVFAEDLRGRGREAFARLALGPGEVRCRAYDASAHPVNMRGRVEVLLLDCAREADERQAAPEGGVILDLAAARTPAGEPPSGDRAVPQRRAWVRAVGGAPEHPRPGPPPLPRPAGSPPPLPAPDPIARPLPRPRPLPAQRDEVAARPQTPEHDGMSDPALPIASHLRALLGAVPGISGAARADSGGSVAYHSGNLDAETTSAVVAMASRPLEQALERLGLGPPTCWTFGTSNASWYVVRLPEGYCVAKGEATRNPETVLGRVQEHVTERGSG